MTCQSVHCCRTLSVVCNVVWRTFCKVHPAQAPVDPRNLRITLGAHNGRDGQRLQSFTATHQNPPIPRSSLYQIEETPAKDNSFHLAGKPLRSTLEALHWRAINSMFARAPKNVRSNFLLPNQRGTLRGTSNMIIRYPGDVHICMSGVRSTRLTP